MHCLSYNIVLAVGERSIAINMPHHSLAEKKLINTGSIMAVELYTLEVVDPLLPESIES